jgi:hypothetical protein
MSATHVQSKALRDHRHDHTGNRLHRPSREYDLTSSPWELMVLDRRSNGDLCPLANVQPGHKDIQHMGVVKSLAPR